MREPGSDEIARIWSHARLIVSSRLLYAEARAALGAAAHAERLGTRGLPSARGELEDLWQDVACVEVTSDVVARAGDLAEEHRLRGYDAVHLSSALEVGAPDIVLVTGDGGLTTAAQASGIATARVPAQSSAG